jgi:itaconyl-CoA hydratase
MTTVTDTEVPRGPWFEDLQPGDVHRSRLGRTINEVDNTWFTALTHNTNQVHFNQLYAEHGRFGRLLVNSCFTLALVTGLSVSDTSENAAANLAWTDIELPNPVYIGDTIWAETQILEVRESASNPEVGIVSVRTRGLNQDGLTVCSFRRTFMAYRRDSRFASSGLFPVAKADWGS